MSYGTVLSVVDGQEVKAGDRLGEWDPFASPIIAETEGLVRYRDLVGGRSLEEHVDEVTFMTRKIVKEVKGVSLKPALELVDKDGELIAQSSGRQGVYSLPYGCTINVADGVAVKAGDILAKIPRETSKTKDITGGLPRVADLFEARTPKVVSTMAKFDGTISFGDDTKGGKRKVILTGDDGREEVYQLAKGRHLLCQKGDYVRKGDDLVDGAANPHEILEVLGDIALANFLIHEIQEVYRLQGVKINDKHIEVIVRQMLRRVRVVDPGDSRLLSGDSVSRRYVMDLNDRLTGEGKMVVQWEPVLLGITKAALSTDSFISAASFQETTKVLTEVSINCKVDRLRGLKENVIMGRLIPAGTGSDHYRGLRAVVSDDMVEDDEVLNTEPKPKKTQKSATKAPKGAKSAKSKVRVKEPVS